MVTYALQPFSNGQPFQPEISQRQQGKEGKSVGKIIITIILILFAIGMLIVCAPVIFCVLLLLGAGLFGAVGGSAIGAIIGGIIGATIVILLIVKVVKFFKKRSKKQ